MRQPLCSTARHQVPTPRQPRDHNADCAPATAARARLGWLEIRPSRRLVVGIGFIVDIGAAVVHRRARRSLRDSAAAASSNREPRTAPIAHTVGQRGAIRAGAWSARSTPGAEWRSTPGAERFRQRPVSSSLSVRSTPRSIYGGVEERSLHDAETALGATSAKLAVTETKLSSAQREIVRLRGLLEARERDLNYTKRLVDRSRLQQGQLANEIELNRELRKAQEEEGGRRRRRRRRPPAPPSSAACAAALRQPNASAASSGGCSRSRRRRACRSARWRGSTRRRRRCATRSTRAATSVPCRRRWRAATRSAWHSRWRLAARRRRRGRRRRRRRSPRSAAAAQAESATLRGELAARDAARRRAAAHARSEREASAAAAERAALASRAEALAADLAAAAAAATSLRDERAALAERAAEASSGWRRRHRRRRSARRTAGRAGTVGGAPRGPAAPPTPRADAEAAGAARELDAGAAAAEGKRAALAEEVSNLTAALDLLAEQHEAVCRRGDGCATTRGGGEQRPPPPRASPRFSNRPTRHAALTERLEALLRELQGTLIERDRLKAALDETLTRCASAVVHQQLAESARAALEQQLAAALGAEARWSSPAKSPR